MYSFPDCSHLSSILESLQFEDLLKKNLVKLYVSECEETRSIDAELCCPVCSLSSSLYIDLAVSETVSPTFLLIITIVTVSHVGDIVPIQETTKTQFTIDLETFERTNDANKLY